MQIMEPRNLKKNKSHSLFFNTLDVFYVMAVVWLSAWQADLRVLLIA